MFSSVLVVCVGNTCRSPVGERMLAACCPDLRVESAGIGALEGHAADETAASVAAENGLSVDGHVARQFTGELASKFDLILVMEPGHKHEIMRKTPELGGRIMLYGQWIGQDKIPDPYTRSREFHETVFEMLRKATNSWAEKLGGKPDE